MKKHLLHRHCNCAKKSSNAESAETFNVKNLIRIFSEYFALLVIVSIVGLCIGPTDAGIGDWWSIFQGISSDPVVQNILLSIRLPRVLGACLAGLALATSGALIQGVLLNPLASDNVLGINAGAGFCVLAASALMPLTSITLPLAAFLGATCVSFLVFVFALVSRNSNLTVILAGLALTSLFSAGMKAILIIDPNAFVGSSLFIVGGLSGVRLEQLFLPGVVIVIAFVLVCFWSEKLNYLQLGEEVSHSLGVSVFKLQIVFLLIASLLAACAVSIAGLIGFVGLLVPHMVRMMVGHNNKLVVPISGLVGASFLIVCDILARSLFGSYELPVGIVLSFIGAPFFLYLIIKHRNNSAHEIR